MADALPIQDHLAIVSPIISSTARVERFAVDSYSVRAQVGINAIDQKLSLQWIGLTASQARTVSNFLNTHAIDLIAFTPAPFTTERYWTCPSHNIEPIANSAYNISAELVREYDPTS